MKYRVISSSDHGSFEDMVSEALEDNWTLYGNLVVTIEYDTYGEQVDEPEPETWYYQAMVKHSRDFQDPLIAHLEQTLKAGG